MIYFRADANAQTGAGHMMRCLTIAQALRVQGDGSFVPGIRFLCADEDSAALPVSRGFQTQGLHTDYRNMESELSLLSTILTGEREEADGESGAPGSGPALFVDSYHVTDAYLATLRAFARVILIDDNMERAYPADVILNYNFHADAGAYRLLYAYGADPGSMETAAEDTEYGKSSQTMEISGTRFLLGPRYAPVRAQFADCGYRVRERVVRILILAGGSDPLNAAGAVYRTLRETTDNIPNINIRNNENDIPSTRERNNENDIPNTSERNNDMPVPAFTLVCGRYSEHAPELDALAKEDGNLRVLHDVEDMASLMCESDLCISACGSDRVSARTRYECIMV